MCASDQYNNVCKGEFVEINSKLDRLDVAIRGNGKPGINTRLDRIEQSRVFKDRLLWLLLGAAVVKILNQVWDKWAV